MVNEKSNWDCGYIRDIDCTRGTPIIHGSPKAPIYDSGQVIRPRILGRRENNHFRKIFLEQLLPLKEYDVFIILFSGGKDSTACYYTLLELGVPKSKIQLWHHDIDGGNPIRKMDWRCTCNYVKAFAQAEGVPLRVSYRDNGFYGELYRVGVSDRMRWYDMGSNVIHDCPVSSKYLQCLDQKKRTMRSIEQYLIDCGYQLGNEYRRYDLNQQWHQAYYKYRATIAGTDDRIELVDKFEEDYGVGGKFPAKGSIRNGRWCSSLLKQMPADALIRQIQGISMITGGRACSGSVDEAIQQSVSCGINQGPGSIKMLVVSGERRGESPGRALYNEIEKHRTNAEAKLHRTVHQWRILIDYSEIDVWEVIKRHKVNVHPCYRAGWNRCSCAMCIFSLPKHFAGIRELYPERYELLKSDEYILNFSLDNKCGLDAYVGDAESCVYYGDTDAIESIITGRFSSEDIYVKDWTYPAGAFHGSAGGPC